MRRNPYLLLMLPLLFFAGCHKEYFELDKLDDEIELNTSILGPVIYGSLHMSDIVALADSIDFVGEFDDGLVYVSYADTFITSVAEDILNLPELETSEFYLEADTDIPVLLPEDTVKLPQRTRSIEFVLEGENRIDSIMLKQGRLGIELRSSFKHTGLLAVSSKQILNGLGQPVELTIFIDDASGNFNQNLWISSDSMRLVPLIRNDSNIINMDFDLSLYNSGAPISPGEECVVQARLEEHGFYNIFGFLDAGDIARQSGMIEIPLWSDNPDLASVEFADPRLAVTFATSVGIPIKVDFDSVIATGLDGGLVELELNDGNYLNFGAPGTHQLGETVVSEFLFDKTTSNIDRFLASAPVEISYDVDGRTSVVDGDSSHFILDTSKVDLSMEFLLPLDFRSSGYGLTDTMEFALGEDGVDTSLVRSAYIRLATINELPLELEIQALFLDESYGVVDSLFKEDKPLLEASEVKADGTLLDASEAVSEVDFPLEKLVKLDRVKYLQIRGRAITSADGAPFVKIYSQYTLDSKISIMADFRINTEEMQ